MHYKLIDYGGLEVERLIKALKAESKNFEYKIYEEAPGGHAFETIDTPLARECRRKIYESITRYLKPPKPIVIGY